jgi:hypothetical protein
MSRCWPLARRARVPVCALLLLIFAKATPGRTVGPWPEVKPFRAVFNVEDGQKPSLDIPIRSVDGRTAYQLECRNWRYEGNPDFSYSGDFECRLVARYEAMVHSTLLTEELHATRDWQSRARFRVPELLGRCGDYADYGRVRTFRLRGMRLRLELRNIRFAPSSRTVDSRSPGLASFRFVIDVQPDLKAQTEIAASSSAPVPPQECDIGYQSPQAR